MFGVVCAGITVCFLCFLCSCDRTRGPQALVQAAIEAHGGHERLARLDNVKILAHGRFKGQLEVTGTISFVAPASFAMQASVGGRPAMQFGMDGDRCWQRTRHMVRDCSADDEREYRRFGEVLRLRLLHRLEERALRSAGYRSVGGVEAPAVSVGGFTLAFDPSSHLLIEISTGNRAEIYSDFRPLGGVLVGATRTLLIDGKLDAQDTWEEVLPGRADEKLLHPPPPAEDGQTLDDVDPERWVATTPLSDLEGNLLAAVQQLDEFARQHGQTVSASEGVVLTQLPRESSSAAPRWELSIGLEPTTAELPATMGSPLRFERWPEARFVGVFHRGDPRAVADRQSLLRRLMDQSGIGPAPDSPWQFVCTRESLKEPVDGRLCLLRIAVEPGGHAAALLDAIGESVNIESFAQAFSGRTRPLSALATRLCLTRMLLRA